MNIRFGMDNFYTRYLKRFLNHHLTRTNGVLGEFKREDLKALIKYLNLPNTETVFEVKKRLITAKIDNTDTTNGGFVELTELFTITVKDDELVFNAKKVDAVSSEYIRDNIDAINNFCKNIGWSVGSVSNWIDMNYDINSDGVINEVDKRVLEDIIYRGMVYDESIMKKADVNLDGYINENDLYALNDYIKNHRIYFIVKSDGRENIFPNKDMLIFVNQFDGEFLDNYAIRDEDGASDIIHPHQPDDTGIGTKVGIYKCRPRSESYDST